MRSQVVKDKWVALWTHYAEIKIKYKLTSHDILRQLNAECRYAYIGYLSSYGEDRLPSTREGTIGIGMWKILASGLTKFDWAPSDATYEEKLTELRRDGWFRHVDTSVERKHEGDIKPILHVMICMDEMQMLDKSELEKMFTIDSIVPIIGEISKSYYL